MPKIRTSFLGLTGITAIVVSCVFFLAFFDQRYTNSAVAGFYFLIIGCTLLTWSFINKKISEIK